MPQSRRPIVSAVAATVLSTTALVVASCGGAVSDPEAELRAWVAAAEEAAENKNRRALLERISRNYADGRGNGRDELGNLFRVYMLRQQSIAILTKIDSIELMGDSAADVALTVGMAGTGQRAFGLTADAYRFELELEKDGGDWLLIGARWGQAGDRLR